MESTQHGGGDTNMAPIRTGNLYELNYERNKELRTEKLCMISTLKTFDKGERGTVNRSQWSERLSIPSEPQHELRCYYLYALYHAKKIGIFSRDGTSFGWQPCKQEK